MKEFVKGRKMSSISLIKVIGEFVNLKGITAHSKRPSFDLKGGLPYICELYWNLVITRIHIDLAKILGPLELVQQVINPWDWIPVSDSDFFLMLNNQCRASRSHPSSVQVQLVSHKARNLVGCAFFVEAPGFSFWSLQRMEGRYIGFLGRFSPRVRSIKCLT